MRRRKSEDDLSSDEDDEDASGEVNGWPASITKEEKEKVFQALALIAKRSSGTNGHLVKLHGPVRRVRDGHIATFITPNELPDVQGMQMVEVSSGRLGWCTVERKAVFAEDGTASPALEVFFVRPRTKAEHVTRTLYKRAILLEVLLSFIVIILAFTVWFTSPR